MSLHSSSGIRSYVREHIREFVASCDYDGKRVLDFGCGVGPYAGVVRDAGGEWTGYNRTEFAGSNAPDLGPDNPLDQRWDVILCTQVLQYVPNPAALLHRFHLTGAVLVMTVPCTWPEVEPEDLWRFTRKGMEHLLDGWQIVRHEPISFVEFTENEHLVLDYGLVATS